MLESFSDIFEKAELVFSVAGLIFVLLQCFFGYKLLRFWIGLIGFAAGFLLGFFLTTAFLPELETFVHVLLGIVCGAILSFLAYRIYLAGVFVYCGLMAFGLAMLIPFPSGEGWKVLNWVLAVIFFILAGYFGVKFSKPCVILITAVSGAVQAVDRISALLPAIGKDMNTRLAVMIVLIVFGILVQFLTTRNQ